MRKTLKIIVLASAASAVLATSAFACKVVGYKNGEALCETTHVYKKKSKSWTNPDDYTKPAEKCRAACLRDAMKWGTSEQQTAYFNMCKRNKGCQ